MEELIFEEPTYKPSTYAQNQKAIKYTVNENDCWEVTNYFKTKDGYTHVKRNGKRIRTHRYSYEIHKGKIPDGMVVRHKCDNPCCINPEHLVCGSQTDNTEDMVSRGRQLSGEQSAKAKLSKEEYTSVLTFLKGERKLTSQEIQRETGVSSKLIKKIADNTHWSCKKYDPTRTELYKLVTSERATKTSKYQRENSGITETVYRDIMDSVKYGLSILETCEKVGLSRSVVNKIRRGRHWANEKYGGK